MNLKSFQNPNKYMSYFLGFLWGDGHISKQNSSITIEIVTSDFQELIPVFHKLGEFHYSSRIRPNRQPQSSIHFSDKNISNFLKSLGYSQKYLSHQRIIEHIPNQFKHLWIRGLFDADGCVYRYDKEYLRQLSISSEYNQDWTYLKQILSSNEVYCKSEQRFYNKSKSSFIRASGLDNIKHLYRYLYPKGYDGIGLTRKCNKLLGIIQDFC